MEFTRGDAHASVKRHLLTQVDLHIKGKNTNFTRVMPLKHKIYNEEQRGRTDIIKILMKQGADANKANSDGSSCAYMPRKKGTLMVS